MAGGENQRLLSPKEFVSFSSLGRVESADRNGLAKVEFAEARNAPRRGLEIFRRKPSPKNGVTENKLLS